MGFKFYHCHKSSKKAFIGLPSPRRPTAHTAPFCELEKSGPSRQISLESKGRGGGNGRHYWLSLPLCPTAPPFQSHRPLPSRATGSSPLLQGCCSPLPSPLLVVCVKDKQIPLFLTLSRGPGSGPGWWQVISGPSFPIFLSLPTAFK